jgi:hypothetical protein
MMTKLLPVLLLMLGVCTAHNLTTAPILVIHGVTANCDYGVADSLASYMNTYAVCYQIGGDEAPLISVIYDINRQGKILCDRVHNDAFLQDGNFSIIAFSQGSILAKYVMEF